jgi:hypothetical protein
MLCIAAKITVPPKAQQLQVLADAGNSSPTGTPAKYLHERCAALAWTRASISSADDPDSWPTTLDASLHPTLLGLYPLPPHRGTDSPPSNFLRLATTIQPYDPNPPPAAGPLASAGAATSQSSGGCGSINIVRPSLFTNTTPPLPPGGASAPSQSTPSALPDASPSTQQMMHDELAALLPPEA